MATANTALNRPRGPALIPPQAPPPNHTHATFCAPLFICALFRSGSITYLISFELAQHQFVSKDIASSLPLHSLFYVYLPSYVR